MSLKGAEFSKVIGTGIQEEIEDSDWPVKRGVGVRGLIIGSLGGVAKMAWRECTRWGKNPGMESRRHLGKEKSIVKRSHQRKDSFLLAWGLEGYHNA